MEMPLKVQIVKSMGPRGGNVGSLLLLQMLVTRPLPGEDQRLWTVRTVRGAGELVPL